MKINVLSIFLLVGIVSSCNKKLDPAPNENTVTIAGRKLEEADKASITNVVKQTNTNDIKLADMAALESASNTQLVFKGSPETLKALKPGQVVLFEGHSIKKISSITESGGKTIVNTTPAKFNEYFKSAKISYSDRLFWTENTIKNARFRVGTRKAFAQEITENGVEFSGSLSGWAISMKLEPEAGGGGRKLNIELTAKRGNSAGIEAKGFISDFQADSNIDMAESNLNSFNHQHNNLNGELTVKYAFLQLSEIAQISIPLEISRTILVNGVIPVTFALKCNLKVFPEVAANSSCQAHLKLTYNGSQGFTYNNRSLASAGTIGGFDVQRVGDTGSASEGIVGVGVGLEFPRFQIGVFGELVVPYIVNNTAVIAYFESGLPFVPGPCNEAKLTLKGSAGVNLSAFGLSYTAATDLYEKKKVFRTPGSKCPEDNNAVPSVNKVIEQMIY